MSKKSDKAAVEAPKTEASEKRPPLGEDKSVAFWAFISMNIGRDGVVRASMGALRPGGAGVGLDALQHCHATTVNLQNAKGRYAIVKYVLSNAVKQ